MELLIFGILILLIALAAWDMLSDIADVRGKRPTQTSDVAEEI